MEFKFNNEIYNVNTEKIDNNINSNINNNISTFKINRIDENTSSVFLYGIKKNIYTAEDENNIYVAFDGDNFIIEKINDEEKSFDSENEVSGDIDMLKPPMPGSIVKVLVEVDQKVEEGEAIIIVEAMKMETTLYSSITGKVTEINAKEGEQVDPNQILVKIEKENEN